MNFLDKLDDGFYFGSGGLGDLLLLLSTFYDDIEKTNLIFWANDKNFIEETLTLFPKIDKKVIFDKWPHNFREQFQEITQHKGFKGKGHIPDNLDYRNEWLNNSDKYLNSIKIPFKHLQSFKYDFIKDCRFIGLSPFGSKVDSWKKKHLNQQEFYKVLDSLLIETDTKIVLLGSSKDKEENPLDNIHTLTRRVLDVRGQRLQDVFCWLNFIDELISTDTWQKTFTGLINIPTIVIKNRYSFKDDLIQRFGVDEDPGDKIFLNKKWNFKLINYGTFTNK